MTSIIVRNDKGQIVGVALTPAQILPANEHPQPEPFVELAEHALVEAHLKVILTDVISEKTGKNPIFFFCNGMVYAHCATLRKPS